MTDEQLQQLFEAALAAGFSKVKLNAVVIRGMNDHEILDLARLTGLAGTNRSE